jgi:hypothetical protein
MYFMGIILSYGCIIAWERLGKGRVKSAEYREPASGRMPHIQKDLLHSEEQVLSLGR